MIQNQSNRNHRVKDEGGETRRRSEHRGKFEGEKKESGLRCRPQRRGTFGSEAASSRGPAGQVLPPACMLLGMDCTETLLRDWPQRQRRAHSGLGSSGSSAGQVLPPACMLMSFESPGTPTHCRLNRRGTLCVQPVISFACKSHDMKKSPDRRDKIHHWVI